MGRESPSSPDTKRLIWSEGLRRDEPGLIWEARGLARRSPKTGNARSLEAIAEDCRGVTRRFRHHKCDAFLGREMYHSNVPRGTGNRI